MDVQTPAPPITEFRGPYRFLSNFYPCRVVHNGRHGPSVEHVYQAAKTVDPREIEMILSAFSPGDAKRLGRRITKRRDWDDIKLDVMRDLVTQKFSTDPELRQLLLDTGDRHLEEGNTWGDRFWGVCDGRGDNHLGEILMDVRAALRQTP